jgi:DNA repair protein RecO
MRQKTSPAMVLRRTNYGEADRIITFLTPAGKVRAMVKGVRRSKSKLAGGIELFSESTITFLETRGDLSRVISSQLLTHWDGIIGDLQRMLFGYETMKLLDTIIEDEAEPAYYDLLKMTLQALADPEVPLQGIEVCFYIRLLRLAGHEPNLKTDHKSKPLTEDGLYTFSYDDMSFAPTSNGEFRAEHIKLLRLALTHKPGFLKQVKGVQKLVEPLAHLLKQYHKRML